MDKTDTDSAPAGQVVADHEPNWALKALSDTVCQVLSRLQAAVSHRGAQVAAVMALAVAAPAQAQSAADIVPRADPAQAQGAQADNGGATAAKSIGGAIIGYQLPRLFGADKAVRVVGGIAGAVFGPSIFDKVTGDGKPQRQAQGQANGRALTPEWTERLNGLLIDAAAARVIAQEDLERHDAAEAAAALNPRDASAGVRHRAARARFDVSMNQFRTSLGTYSNALGVLMNQRYDVAQYQEAAGQLQSQLVSGKPLPIVHQAVYERVAQRQQEEAVAVQAQQLNQAMAVGAAVARNTGAAARPVQRP